MTLLRWLATCPEDTVPVLTAELTALGAQNLAPLHRGVTFEADLATGYRAHLWLRSASRIQRVITDLPASSLGEFTASLGTVAWPEWVRAQKPFSVDAVLIDNSAKRMDPEAVRQAVANSVVTAFKDATAPRYNPDAEDPITIVAHIKGRVCTLGLDTAGKALHKRGWRVNGHPAVIKETLAASILLHAGYDGSEPFLDPMCGSGTIAIEAAYIALHKAPLIHRKKDEFGFEHQAHFDRALWRKVSDEARAAKKAAPAHPIFASDIRGPYVELAKQGALRARVEKFITFQTSPFEALERPADSGLLVANLPYGERIGRGETATIYTSVGRVIRERFSRWRCALLVPEDAPMEALNLDVKREIKMLNGALEVRLLITG